MKESVAGALSWKCLQVIQETMHKRQWNVSLKLRGENTNFGVSHTGVVLTTGLIKTTVSNSDFCLGGCGGTALPSRKIREVSKGG